MRFFKSFLTTLTAVGMACSGGDTKGADTAASTAGVDLTGAGATFPQPIYNKWFHDYGTATGVRINYQAIGSGGGIKQLQEGIVDFGASDSPMTDQEIAAAKHGAVLHFPTVLGAVVITYNLPNVASPLRLTGQEIADIFNGAITKWNDPRLAALNPSVKLPPDDILVVHRSDGSGTTYIFTDYLSKMLRHKSVIFLVSDFMDEGLEHPLKLLAQRHDVVAVTVGDAQTDAFTIDESTVVLDEQPPAGATVVVTYVPDCAP